MIDHLNIPVKDMAASRAFYDAALAAFGWAVILEDGDAVGYGDAAWVFGLVPARHITDPLHFAFKAHSRAEVDAFHQLGVGAGGTCNGAPGERPHYGAGYYAGYLTDPDGHNIEAVFRG